MGSKFVFAGNRTFVLEKMLSLGLQVTKIWVSEGSFLQNYLENNNLDICYSIIRNKQQLICEIADTDFNYFISNGLPVILPVKELQMQNKKFINIHPSLLPELRGRDPVPGGLLYEKALGATCHYMDDGIDTGKIISQVEIDRSDDLDAGLLYQLSFLAEVDVFEQAYNRNFEVVRDQVCTGKEIYYSFKSRDLEIDLRKDSVNAILAKVKAFSTKNKGAFFVENGITYKCVRAEVINNRFFKSKIDKYRDLSIVMKYEQYMIVRKGENFIRFELFESR